MPDQGGPPTAVKVVVTGPFAAGKTTFISTLSEIPLFSTEKPVSDSSREIKSMTTVSMDFGKLSFHFEEGDVVLYLFGTPGQERFDFMWDVLARGMLGFIVLVDVTREKTFKEARKIVKYFRKLSDVPFVVGANRATGHEDVLDKLREKLGLDDETPVVPCEVVSRQSAKEVLLALLYRVSALLGEEKVATRARK
jgi:small GTP-binding protein